MFESSIVPPVAALDSDSRVASFAKGHEIVLLIATTFGEREDVVDFLYGRQLTLLPTLFAERVHLDVLVTDTFPGTAILFVGLRIKLIFIVTMISFLLMLITVLVIGQPWTSWALTGALWLLGHRLTSHLGETKTTTDFSAVAHAVCFIFLS